MISYIKRELGRAFHRKYTYAYVLGILALCLLANIAVIAFRTIYGTNDGTYAYNLIEYATWCFIIPYYSCIFIADVGFGKVYPNPQIKDNVTFFQADYRAYFSIVFCDGCCNCSFCNYYIIPVQRRNTFSRYDYRFPCEDAVCISSMDCRSIDWKYVFVYV